MDGRMDISVSEAYRLAHFTRQTGDVYETDSGTLHNRMVGGLGGQFMGKAANVFFPGQDGLKHRNIGLVASPAQQRALDLNRVVQGDEEADGHASAGFASVPEFGAGGGGIAAAINGPTS